MDPIKPKVPDSLARQGITHAEHSLEEDMEIQGLPKLIHSFFGKELMASDLVQWRKKEPGGEQ